MREKNGFTLLEVAMVMVILGIMATFAIIKYQKTVIANELEKTANNLLSELSACRTLALKNDTRVLVKFSSIACTLFIDTNDNSIADSSEKYKVYVLTPSTISFGIATNGPSVGPSDVDFSTSGIAGNWNNYMIVESNAAGTFNSGAVYISSSRLEKYTYCIGKSTTSQFLKLYKWGGISWISL